MNALEKLIGSALNDGKPTYYEVMPEDFGADMARGALLRECLLMMLSRYPLLQIQVVGAPDTLAKFALIAGARNRVGLFHVPASWGPTYRNGAIRLVFCRGVSIAPRNTGNDADGGTRTLRAAERTSSAGDR